MNIIVDTQTNIVIDLGETIENYNDELWKVICSGMVGYCRKSPLYQVVYDVDYPDQPNEYGQYFMSKYIYKDGVFTLNPNFVEE